MNLYLIDVVVKFIRIIFVAFISLFNFNIYNENVVKVENTINNVDTYAINSVDSSTLVNQLTTTKVENTVQKSTQPAKNNLNNITTTKTVTNTTKTVETATKKILTTEKSQISLGDYTGKLTGYGPDCYGCSGKGNLACKTREKKTFNLIKDGIYYNDTEYGKVRILSAATSKFKCGTIIVVTKPGSLPYTAIVLDTGGDMIKAWNNGEVWMDLAYSSTTMVSSDKLTGKNIKFSVQRWGW